LPHSKSARKRVRQNERRRRRNRSIKSYCKTTLKRVEQALQHNDKDQVKSRLAIAMSAWHKAAAKGVVHRRTAARKISRLSQRVFSQLGSI
jgi:small subunit ribosomal protein S20